MSRELRLAFAMGGGVSLGTFSGAALTEAMKLAVLYGAYPSRENGRTTWTPYDRVVVDVFSGASAGAMALAAMLRSLVHQTPEQRQQAEEQLRRDHGMAFERLPRRKKKRAVAAQVAQTVQERVWVDEVDIHRLLGRHNGRQRDLRHVGGVLDRRAVDDIARTVIGFPEEFVSGGKVQLNRKSSLLADRALFACTLANLSPLVHDARGDLKATPETGFVGLEDGLTSRVHRDIRIFDLNFEPVDTWATAHADRYPSRWLRYHADAKDEGRIGDLRAERTWKRIAATSIAAGAFPFAFEPVVLARKAFEYGDLWPFETGEDGEPVDEYPFTYVDGGLFNNEPIREAFRMASVVDGKADPSTYDRRVVFVDPNAGGKAVSYRVPIHETHAYQKPNLFGRFDGTDLFRKSSLDRLLPHVGQLLGALRNESSVNEGDSIFQVRRRFENRNRMRAFLGEAITEAPSRTLLEAVRDYCEELLESDAENMVLPAGTLTLSEELKRVVAEEQAGRRATPLLDDVDPEAAGAFLDALADGADLEKAGVWLRALLFVAQDLTLTLEGKRPTTCVVAIAPAEFGQEDGEPTVQPVALKGGWMFGFGGFTSPVPGRHEVALARFCARRFLKFNDLLPPDVPPAHEPAWTDAMQQQYERDFSRGLDAVIRRVDGLIGDSHILNLSAFNSVVAKFISSFVEKRIESFRNVGAPPSTEVEFQIEVPGRRYELDGDRDQRPLRREPGRRWVIVTKAAFDGERWSGPFIDEDAQRIVIDQEGLRDRHFCTIDLPKQVEALRFHPHPVFHVKVTSADRGTDTPIGAQEWTPVPAPPPGTGPAAPRPFGLTSLEEEL